MTQPSRQNLATTLMPQTQSVLLCDGTFAPVDPAGTAGTQQSRGREALVVLSIRPEPVETLATDAGFDTVEMSDIDAGFFTLYALRP